MDETHNKEILAEKFALRIIKLEKHLRFNLNERRISDQIFRPGTSIGANIAESKYAESKSDFIHKLSIAQKEANETLYWLNLLYKGEFINVDLYNSLSDDCKSLKNILSMIILKMKRAGGAG